MKTQNQSTPELARLCELIAPMPVAMMTTLDDASALVSRPMTALEMDAQGRLWFFTDMRSTKLDQLLEMNLTFSDVGRGDYVSLSGHGEIETDRARVHALWSAFAKPWFPEGPDSPHLALLKFVPAAADLWDSPSSRMVRLFAMAASIVAGKPLGLGEHENFANLAAGSALGGKKAGVKAGSAV